MHRPHEHGRLPGRRQVIDRRLAAEGERAASVDPRGRGPDPPSASVFTAWSRVAGSGRSWTSLHRPARRPLTAYITSQWTLADHVQMDVEGGRESDDVQRRGTE